VLCERWILAVDPPNRWSAPRRREAGVDVVLPEEQAGHRRPTPRSGIIPLATVELTKTLNDTVRVWLSRAYLRSPGEQSPEIARDGEKRAPIRAIDRGAIRGDADRAGSGGLPLHRRSSRAAQGHRRQ